LAEGNWLRNCLLNVGEMKYRCQFHQRATFWCFALLLFKFAIVLLWKLLKSCLKNVGEIDYSTSETLTEKKKITTNGPLSIKKEFMLEPNQTR